MADLAGRLARTANIAHFTPTSLESLTDKRVS